MDISQLESSWDNVKGKLKQHYGQLTDDDLIFVEGKGEELMGRLKQKLGISNEELNATLDNISSGSSGAFTEVTERVAEISEQVRTKAGEVVEDLKHRAAVVSEEAKLQGAIAYDEARQRARGFWADGEEYVRAHPRQSILAAVAAGFVARIVLLRR